MIFKTKMWFVNYNLKALEHKFLNNTATANDLVTYETMVRYHEDLLRSR
mgnify:CR=1 FL=1